MASSVDVVLGSVAFAIFWILAVSPSIPFMPIGRTAGSLLGAMLMVLFQVMTPDQAYAAINLPILGLLFGTMVVSIYLERADMFKYLGKLLSWKSMGPKDVICRICLISAIASALFTNDTTCVILTEFVLKIARQHNLPPHPFLLALATSANIGSAATPIGNPQNLVIAMTSKISFGDFLIGILPAMLVGLVLNALLLMSMYWRSLSDHSSSSLEEITRNRASFAENEMIQTVYNNIAVDDQSNAFAINMTSTDDDDGSSEWSNDQEIPLLSNKQYIVRDAFYVEYSSKSELTKIIGWKEKMWKPCVYLVTIGMLISFLMGLDMSWTAITAALALIVLDYTDAQPCLKKVSYPLLIFFCGMFTTVEGFNKTGIPSIVWDLVKPYAKINNVMGITVLAIVILVLSNLASNVPAVLLLGVPVSVSAAAISATHENRAWLILAWVSTVGGNLSLLGSAANLIVCEQARHAPLIGYNLSFSTHLKFGLPSTLIVTAIGLAILIC